ncbi:MAG: deoxyhypusine synthase [Candidatus Woesearchaeota archaeon]
MTKKLHYQIKKPVDLSNLLEVKGHDFEKGTDLHEVLKSMKKTGIQATELAKSIEIAHIMQREKAAIFLSYTSNMVSSGVREPIKYLVKHKKVHVLVTSAGGVEEDAIKSIMPFRIGNFYANGKTLFDSGIVRIGNIFATTEHYTYFEFFIRKVFDRLANEKAKNNKSGICIVTPSEIASMMGKLIGEEKNCDEKGSILYYAYKNNIPLFCPGIVDGAIGDILYYYKMKNNKFYVDVGEDHKKIIDFVLSCKKTGAIILGGGISKHYVLNANIFKDGLDYAVYITTADSYDASDSGGDQEEAITWAKIRPEALRAKVFCDASIAFPLLVAGAFVKEKDKKK